GPARHQEATDTGGRGRRESPSYSLRRRILIPVRAHCNHSDRNGPTIVILPAITEDARMAAARWMNRILQGDCRTLRATLPDESIDLTVTSPPYADQRKHTYGGVSPDEYVEWFAPI